MKEAAENFSGLKKLNFIKRVCYSKLVRSFCIHNMEQNTVRNHNRAELYTDIIEVDLFGPVGISCF
uniref:Uncharacterized protein, isoform A n=1 Tax=Drosophila pseudoobscura pseudoobscura TaxID=46245 RepID=A0A0R3NW83_DROPS